MLYFNTIRAFGMVAFFTLVASQTNPRYDCNKWESQSIVVDECVKAAYKFGGSGRVFSYKPYGNAHCHRSCQVTIKLAYPPASVSGTSETEVIAKAQVERTIQDATGPQQCGRVSLTASVQNYEWKWVTIELKSVKGRCLEK